MRRVFAAYYILSLSFLTFFRDDDQEQQPRKRAVRCSESRVNSFEFSKRKNKMSISAMMMFDDLPDDDLAFRKKAPAIC